MFRISKVGICVSYVLLSVSVGCFILFSPWKVRRWGLRKTQGNKVCQRARYLLEPRPANDLLNAHPKCDCLCALVSLDITGCSAGKVGHARSRRRHHVLVKQLGFLVGTPLSHGDPVSGANQDTGTSDPMTQRRRPVEYCARNLLLKTGQNKAKV